MNGFLLDTNIVSETRKPRPDPGVVGFLRDQLEPRLHVSVLTLGELRKGALLKSRSDRRMGEQLIDWVDTIETSFGGRVIGIDTSVAKLWGKLAAARSRPVIDGFLAATAIVHELTMVTGNSTDFDDLDLSLINPFSGGR